MKLSEILSKVIGLDPSKEYNIAVDEIKQEVQQQTQTPVETNRDDKPAQDNSSSIAELNALRAQLESLTNENATLKELNKHLVLNTPAEPEKSVEQRIMELCFPQYSKGEENA